MKNTFHVQCRMTRNTGTSDLFYTAWIPEEFAKKGKNIEIDGQGGWKVIEVGNRLPTPYVYEHERDFVRQREASDV